MKLFLSVEINLELKLKKKEREKFMTWILSLEAVRTWNADGLCDGM
jgi:hypothetical protein